MRNPNSIALTLIHCSSSKWEMITLQHQHAILVSSNENLTEEILQLRKQDEYQDKHQEDEDQEDEDQEDEDQVRPFL